MQMRFSVEYGLMGASITCESTLQPIGNHPLVFKYRTKGRWQIYCSAQVGIELALLYGILVNKKCSHYRSSRQETSFSVHLKLFNI